MKNKRINKNENGFTLVELLIYMGLLSILLVSITEMFVSILQVKVDSEAFSSVEQDSQYIYSRMVYDINRADAITTPASPGQSDTTLVLVINGENYTYSINGSNELVLTNNSGTYKLNGSETDISNLNIQKIGPVSKNTAVVDLTLNSKTTTNTGTEERNINFTAGIR